MAVQVQVDHARLRQLCQKWHLSEFAFCGSVLRSDFHATSDVDVVVAFAPEAHWSAWDLITMSEELSALFGRPVDVIERDAIRNPYRRQSILGEREIVYAA